MFDVTAVQQALGQFGIDGWLIYDFRGSNLLGRRVLGLPDQPVGSRRWFYYVPARGSPQKLVHRIEPTALAHLPGAEQVYLRWQELEAGVAAMLRGARRVAMEYSPRNANPYLSRVDAGTVELVRGCGVEVVSSGDLIQQFEAIWDDEQIALHLEAARHTDTAFHRVWTLVADRIRREGGVAESAVQAEILKHFAEHDLVTYHPPIVAANEHSSDPHFENSPGNDRTIREGDWLLVDLWAKCNRPRAVYSDLTRVGYVGTHVPAEYAQVFSVVAQARDAAIACIQRAFAEGRPLAGWEVDRVARQVIEQAGYADRFVHRTGHSIGQEVHGNGANIDSLETREERRLLPRTCFSIEPGIYLDTFGVRSEVNVLIDAAGRVQVTGGEVQQAPLAILAQT
jgi:Xaa-Pro aminopeptidase